MGAKRFKIITVPGRRGAAVALGAAAVLLGACSRGSPGSSVTPSGAGASVMPTASAAVSGATPSPRSTAAPVRTPGPSAPAIAMPSSCTDSSLKSIVAGYTGSVSTAEPSSPGAAHGTVSCGFTGSKGSVTLTLGPGSVTDLENTQAAESQGSGVTVEPVAGLGVVAFALKSNGAVTGLDAIGSNNLVVSLTSGLSLSQDEALARQLLSTY